MILPHVTVNYPTAMIISMGTAITVGGYSFSRGTVTL